MNANPEAPDSVHLADWPPPEERLMDEDLSRRMAAARRVVALGRAARNAAAVKNRQPLREVVVVAESSEGGDLAEGVEDLKDIVLDELRCRHGSSGGTRRAWRS